MRFDPFKKERELRAESENWDTSNPQEARDGDIPVIDLGNFFATGSKGALSEIAAQLKAACEQTGFFSIVGHQIPATQIADMFDMTRRFHGLDQAIKKSLLMDRAGWRVKGVGYLPFKNRKLPTRDKGNLNEAFIVKTDDQVRLADNQWPADDVLPGFRRTVTDYAEAMEALGKKLLPLFATALDMPANYFDEAFVTPTWRLRMTHYPAIRAMPQDEFGIAPHVDTTFCTILAQDQPGLIIYSERRKEWIKAPLLDNAFIVNSGELLRQWTNDRFISVKHFANNNIGAQSRYSIPFFLNANRHYKMHCIPSCFNRQNPAKYPPISYTESQAVAQGE